MTGLNKMVRDAEIAERVELYETLHDSLLAIGKELVALAEHANMSRGSITIDVTCDKYDGVEVKYCVGERYGEHAKGNELHAVMREAMRRFAWDTANNAKLIASS